MKPADHAPGTNGGSPSRKPKPEEDRREKFILRLYITGSTPRSSRSIINVRAFCERFLLGRCDLQVVDLYQQPELAREEQILASPTLVKKFPLPLRKIVGDFSDQARVLQGLQLTAEEA
jgi:circadian clock protein KaiB